MQETQKEMVVSPIQSDFPVVIANIQRVPEFIKFIRWFAMPSHLREPQTQKEFAALVGVCEDSLTDWKRHPQFWPLVWQAISDWVREQIPDAVGALCDKALSKGQSRDVLMLIKLAGVEFNNNKNK